MTHRATAALIAVAVVVTALGYLWLRERESDFHVPALPDISRLDASVQQALRDRHAALTALLADDDTTRANVAEASGAYGTLLLAAELPDEAEGAFLHAQRLAPADRRWPYYLAHVYRARQEPARAIPMFARTLELAPDDVPSLVWLGELHLSMGNADAAEPYLERAAILQPASAAVVSRLGRVALARRDYPRAIEQLERTLSLQADAASVHYPLGMAYRGAGDVSQAEVHLRQASDSGGIAPTDPLMDAVGGLLETAAAYEARGMEALEARDWRTAVEHLRKAVNRAPGNATTRLNLGTALSLAGDAAAAEIELAEAARLDPTLAKAHFSLGLLAQDAGRWDDAVDRFTTAIRQDAGFVDAHFTLAEALRRTGRAEESLAEYEQVLRLNGAASQARFGYAMALVRLHRYVAARRALEEAVALHPDQPGFPHALARILAAAPEDAARNGARALTLMQPLAAVQAGPAVSETMAMVHAELGRFAEAVAWQERAMTEARQTGQGALASRMGENVELYRRGRPCRTPWRDDDPVIAVAARR